MVIDKIIITPDGKKCDVLRSALSATQINLQNGEVLWNGLPNEDVRSRLARVWPSMRP